MKKKVFVSASILSADFLNLESDLKNMESCGIDYHHMDVMDGHFVDNLSFGLRFIESVKKVASVPLDVHLMISNPDTMATRYVDVGADMLSFHIEATHNPVRLIERLKEKNSNLKVGVSFNPDTPVEMLSLCLKHIDFINLMSVYPGYSGQSFIESSFEKVKKLNEYLIDLGLRDNILIEIDGGVGDKNAGKLVESGVDILVSGNFIYKKVNEDRKNAVKSLKCG